MQQGQHRKRVAMGSSLEGGCSITGRGEAVMRGREGGCSEPGLGSNFCGAVHVPPQQVGHSGWAELEEDAAGGYLAIGVFHDQLDDSSAAGDTRLGAGWGWSPSLGLGLSR